MDFNGPAAVQTVLKSVGLVFVMGYSKCGNPKTSSGLEIVRVDDDLQTSSINDMYILDFFVLSEKLEEKKQEETDSKFFTEMPSKHYMEVTQLLLK